MSRSTWPTETPDVMARYHHDSAVLREVVEGGPPAVLVDAGLLVDRNMRESNRLQPGVGELVQRGQYPPAVGVSLQARIGEGFMQRRQLGAVTGPVRLDVKLVPIPD